MKISIGTELIRPLVCRVYIQGVGIWELMGDSKFTSSSPSWAGFWSLGLVWPKLMYRKRRLN